MSTWLREPEHPTHCPKHGLAWQPVQLRGGWALPICLACQAEQRAASDARAALFATQPYVQAREFYETHIWGKVQEAYRDEIGMCSDVIIDALVLALKESGV